MFHLLPLTNVLILVVVARFECVRRSEKKISGDLKKNGLDWTGLDWTGMDWNGMDCPRVLTVYVAGLAE